MHEWESIASSKGNHVADCQLLKLRNDVIRTWTIEIAEQTIEPVIAVQPAASIPHLQEPRPDVLRSRVNGERMRC